MNHRAILCRALPAAALAAVLLAGSLPASAFLFDREETTPAVVSISKNGPVTDSITFSREEFVVEGDAALSTITLSALPDAGAGLLTLGGQPVQVGDVVSVNALDGLRFDPQAVPTVTETQFRFLPTFMDGQTGEEASAQIYLLAEKNEAPVAERLELTTYKNVAITERFAAVDPEGDLLTYHIIDKPARGAVTQTEEGGSEFVYTPYENKTGKDSFTYVAVDAVGNTSAPATVKVRIQKADTKVTYADLDGSAAHKAAIRLAEEEIFVGECMGGQYFFQPDASVSRGEFVAMAMEVAGVEALSGVERTGFADDGSIPTWAKPYASSALKAGLVQGSRDADGQVCFQADAPITAAEAAVLLERALQVTDVSADAMAAVDVPAWAAQSAADLSACGVLYVEDGLGDTLTRADAAQLLCAALELQDSRETDSIFPW